MMCHSVEALPMLRSVIIRLNKNHPSPSRRPKQGESGVELTEREGERVDWVCGSCEIKSRGVSTAATATIMANNQPDQIQRYDEN